MPRVARELKPVEINRLQPKHDDRPTLYPVGGVPGLHVQVTPTGYKSWVLRVTIAGKRRHMGLGSLSDVKLGEAREEARKVRGQIRSGEDPFERRRDAKRLLIQRELFNTIFADAVDEYTPVAQQELKEGKYRDQWADSLNKYAIPVIGKKPVNQITKADVLDVLRPIWKTKTVTADKLRLKMKRVFDYCKGQGYCGGDNPAEWEGNLSLVLSSPAKVSGAEHYPALQLNDLSRFWQALAKRNGMGAEALRFQMLTATRTGAVRFMTWQELDLHDKVWTVQPGRQSAKISNRDTPKRVPLTDEMVTILKRIPRLNGNEFVFSAPKGGALSDATLGKLMRVIHDAEIRAGNSGFVDAKTGEIVVPHGTRSTFKVWASEAAGYDWHLSEAALWHALGNKVERAYARTDMLEQRREMMDGWGQFIATSKPA